MNETPKFIKKLAQKKEVEQALKYCERQSERLDVLLVAQEEGADIDREEIKQHAHDVLMMDDVQDVSIDRDVAHIHCGQFTGTHGLRDGGYDSVGSYTYEVSVDDTMYHIDFKSHCPSETKLQRVVRNASNSEPTGEAAKETFRNTRM